MIVNSDFSQPVQVHSASQPWLASPMAGVARRPLDRVGEEVARATSIVRYAPGSHFSPHVHHGGEEFLVLEGVFQDEEGDYPAGTYVRNPPGSRHQPGSKPGCMIFVKLWQFEPEDQTPVRLSPEQVPAESDPGRSGVTVQPLFSGFGEQVRLEQWPPGATTTMDLPGGGEWLVLEGNIEHSGTTLGKHDWLRLPVAGQLQAVAGPEGAVVWVKTGHLQNLEQQVQRLQAKL